jgi:hypothetical protein
MAKKKALKVEPVNIQVIDPNKPEDFKPITINIQLTISSNLELGNIHEELTNGSCLGSDFTTEYSGILHDMINQLKNTI